MDLLTLTALSIVVAGFAVGVVVGPQGVDGCIGGGLRAGGGH